MSKFKEKASTFIFGFLFGLIIAGSFFILKLDDYFKELKFYKQFSETLSSFNNKGNDKNNSFSLSSSEGEGKTENKKTELFSTKKDKSIKKDTVIISSINETLDDSVISLANSATDEIIKKDELIVAKIFNLINLNPTAKVTAQDSLLTKVSGVYSDSDITKMMSVEFWQSPLKFKGYKMSKYKVVVFGLKLEMRMKLYKLDDAVFLKNGNTVYQFDYTGEFKGYKQITDEAILSRLK